MAVVKTRKKKKRRSFASRGAGVARGSGKKPVQITKAPACADVCPAGNRIRDFVTTLAQAEDLGKSMDEAYEEAFYIYTDISPFPATCGRICPHLCEAACNRNEIDGAVGINKIERAVGDFGLERELPLKKVTDEVRDEKIAIVGAGPAGLTCAYHLARNGYPVTIFEATHKPGGMLLWGIPRYRLPDDILAKEIQKILELGPELKLNTKVGIDVPLDELRRDYKAIFVGIGAHQGKKLRVEGEDAENVISGVAFLNRIHHGETIDVGDDVIVVGGGDTAVDAARICRRLGATTTIVYRRSRKEMPAIDEEIEEALKEGVRLEYLVTPIGFKTDNGRITHMECIRQELGEPDASGRRRPISIPGTEFDIPATTVIPAISQEPDFTGFDGLIEGRDWFKVDDHQELLKEPGMFAGGDAVWLDIASTAIGHGRCAAQAIDFKLRGLEMPEPKSEKVIKADKLRKDYYEKVEPLEGPTLPIEERLADMLAEVNQGLTREQAVTEAQRCLSCGYCFYCEQCYLLCSEGAISKPANKGELFTIDISKCTGCDKCAEVCPCGFIEMM